jgi:hypothetical protein
MRLMIAAVVLAQVLCASAGVGAQSLGEVAKQEEARRKAIKKPSKVYTNDSLRSEPAPSPPPPVGPATPPPSPQPAPATPAASDEVTAPPAPAPQVRDEKYWRTRLEAARTSLSRSQTLAEALQSRINALSADFVNRDDPAQRAVIANDRQRALAELDRVKQEIATAQKSIADVQEEARRAGVPAGWVR